MRGDAWLLPVVSAAAAGTFAVIGVFGAAAPPPPARDAPATDFSADRARAHIVAISGEPRHIGSPAHERARQYLRHEFAELGLNPVTSDDLATETGSGSAVIAPVRNLQATLPGHDATGRVLVMAHYDSTMHSPGASDDGLGVGTLLEVARALRAGPQPRNDVRFLLTDGEEVGLLGARAYAAAAGEADAVPTVVVNLDAAGTSGRAVMFETGTHSAALLPALRDRPPVTTSVSSAVYELLPHDTDFTVLREAGLTGLNFAVVEGSANYHNTTDSVANLDPATLQDLGSTVLGAVTSLGGTDLGRIHRAPEATYATVAGVLLWYSQGWVLPLGLVALAAAVAALWWSRPRPRAVAAATLTLPVLLVAAALVGQAGWWVLGRVRPEYTGFVFGDPHRPDPILAGLALCVVGIAVSWGRACARRGDAMDVGAGVVLWYAILAAATAVVLPAAAYLFTWPALTGALTVAVLGRRVRRRWHSVAVSAAVGVPAALLVLPLAVVLADAAGLALTGGPLVLTALVVAPFTAISAARPGAGPRRRMAPALAVLAAGVMTLSVGVAVDGSDRRHPAPTSLVYALDVDAGRARWLSDGTGATDWSRRYATGPPTTVEDTFPLLTGVDRWHGGAAPVTAAATPVLNVLGRRAVGVDREIRVRLTTERGAATRLSLYAGGDRIVAARMGTAGVPGGHNRSFAAGPWTWGLLLPAPAAGGDELVLTVHGTAPVRLLLEAQSPGLPGMSPPESQTWAARQSGISLSVRTFVV